MLEFFEKVVFQRKVRKVMDPYAGCSRQNGIAVQGAGRQEVCEAAGNNGPGAIAFSVTFAPATIPAAAPTELESFSPDASTEAADSEDEAVDHEMVNNSSSTRNNNEYSNINTCNYEAGSEFEAEGISVEEQSLTDATAESRIASITEKNKVLQGEKDEYGNTIIFVPVGFAAVDMARKALIFLWKEQSSRLAPLPSLEPNPRQDIPLMKAIEGHEVKLVHESVSQSDKTAHSAPDTYTPSDFIRMLSFLWRELPPTLREGKRAYNRVKRYQHMRERFCLLARHHMLLLDEDIRNANLSDTFSLLKRNSLPGSGVALGLVFCLPNKRGDNMYATTFRHKNINRCTVGGFAFYMFERFELAQELLPDFSKPDEWHRVKVLVGGSVKDRLDPRSSHFRFLSLDPKTQNDSTSAVMRSCQVYSPNITRMGRNAGVMEAHNLGLRLEDIRHLGRSSIGQMETAHPLQNTISGAFAMAHFKNEPYFIERDLVSPPLELQRKIFSWIEDTFDIDHPELRNNWIKDCEKLMMGVDPTEPTEDDLHYVPADSDSNEKTAKDLVQSGIVCRMAFLELLVRLRRVILQDAVIFRRKDSQGRTLTNSLITSRPDIFQSPLFLQFEMNLLTAIENQREQANLFPREIADGEAVVGGINDLADKVQHLTVTTSALLTTLSHNQGQDLSQQQLRLLDELKPANLDICCRTEMILRILSAVTPQSPLQVQGEHRPREPEQQQGQGSGTIYFHPPLLQRPYVPPIPPQRHPHPQPSQWSQSPVRPSGHLWYSQPQTHPVSVQPPDRSRPSLRCKSKRSLKEVYHDYLIADNEALGDNRTHRRRKALFRDIEKLQKRSDKDFDTFLDELDQELKTTASVKAFTNAIHERAAKI